MMSQSPFHMEWKVRTDGMKVVRWKRGAESSASNTGRGIGLGSARSEDAEVVIYL